MIRMWKRSPIWMTCCAVTVGISAMLAARTILGAEVSERGLGVALLALIYFLLTYPAKPDPISGDRLPITPELREKAVAVQREERE